jgi:cysteinyl-tRNA synthetase
MDDDFNTPIALAVLFQLSHELNKNNDPVLAATLRHLSGIMGLLYEDPVEFLQAGFADEDKSLIDILIAERIQARTDKNWAKADSIRAELLNKGIEIEDGAEGTTWRKITE